MAKHILKCKECGKDTMAEKCSCDGSAVKIGPAKYSPEDKYGEYRRKVKKEELQKRGLL